MRHRVVVILALALAAQAPAQQRAQRAVVRRQGETLRVPATIEGASIDIVTQAFKPEGEGPFPFVLYAHGRASSAELRAKQAHRGLIEGQSVGGMTTVALAALNPPGVLGAVNFAGGSGGNPTASPGRSCKPCPSGKRA